MEDIDVNILVQVFNEKINSLVTESIIKDTKIRQLITRIEELEATVSKSSKLKKEENFE